MNWYLVKIVFQVMFSGKQHTAQFDEQLRIIKANDKIAALNKAKQLGEAEAGSIINIGTGEPIHWKFINVSNLYHLKELLDGAEIFSCTHETDDAHAYIDSVHKKAEHIKNSDTLEILQLV